MHNNCHEHYRNHFTVAGLMKMSHLFKYVHYTYILRDTKHSASYSDMPPVVSIDWYSNKLITAIIKIQQSADCRKEFNTCKPKITAYNQNTLTEQSARLECTALRC